MPKVNLTATAVQRFKPPKADRIEYFDRRLPGFALRISKSGRRTWVLFYRIGGRQRRLSLGCPQVSLGDQYQLGLGVAEREHVKTEVTPRLDNTGFTDLDGEIRLAGEVPVEPTGPWGEPGGALDIGNRRLVVTLFNTKR